MSCIDDTAANAVSGLHFPAPVMFFENGLQCLPRTLQHLLLVVTLVRTMLVQSFNPPTTENVTARVDDYVCRCHVLILRRLKTWRDVMFFLLFLSCFVQGCPRRRDARVPLPQVLRNPGEDRDPPPPPRVHGQGEYNPRAGCQIERSCRDCRGPCDTE